MSILHIAKRMDSLRELVTRYIVHEQTQIAGAEPCLLLVEECGSVRENGHGQYYLYHR